MALLAPGVAQSTEPDVLLADENFEQRWNWTGFSAGVDAGYSWQKDQTNNTGLCFFDPSCKAYGDGDVYGFFVGYSHQSDNIVAGVEASYTHHDVVFEDGSQVVVKDTYALKARLGYAIDRFHAYGLMGAVYGSTTAHDTTPFLEDSDVGVIYGAGVDVGVTEEVFAGLQYTHQSYRNFAGIEIPTLGAPDIDADIDVITMRLGYKF